MVQWCRALLVVLPEVETFRSQLAEQAPALPQITWFIQCQKAQMHLVVTQVSVMVLHSLVSFPLCSSKISWSQKKGRSRPRSVERRRPNIWVSGNFQMDGQMHSKRVAPPSVGWEGRGSCVAAPNLKAKDEQLCCSKISNVNTFAYCLFFLFCHIIAKHLARIPIIYTVN